MVQQPQERQPQGSIEIIWSEVAEKQWIQFLSGRKRGRPIHWIEPLNARLLKSLERIGKDPFREKQTNCDNVFCYAIDNGPQPHMTVFYRFLLGEPHRLEVLAIMESRRSDK